MQKEFRRFFAPPVFEGDEDKTRSAAFLTIVAWSTIISIMLMLLVRIAIRLILQPSTQSATTDPILLAGMIAMAPVLILTYRGYVRAAGVLTVATLWAGLCAVAWMADGIRDAAFWGLTIPILVAGLLLGWKGSIIITGTSILAAWTLGYAESNQFIHPTIDTPLNYAVDVTAIFILAGVLLYLIISSLQKALNRSRIAVQQLSASNQELNNLRADLEQHIEERTAEVSHRAMQLEAVSSVARTIATVQDSDTLLPSIAKVVSQQFGFYHVGIFLLDEQAEKAVLSASNSPGGLKMLKAHHTLLLDDHSIVGYAVSRREPRIALDVGADSVHFNNPDLPDTRSEMALPLRVGRRVIGALDVQSTQTNAFSQEDIGVLATLADQIAIAIENARLFGEAKDALDESRAMFEKYTQQEWTNFARQMKQTGFIFDGKQVAPLNEKITREAVLAVPQPGHSSLDKATTSIVIPIKLRGQIVGILDVRSKKGEREWKQDELTLLEAAADRAALALENARLVESAQRRAARERAIGDISARIGAVSNLESILQTTVEELGRKIGGATEVMLEISSDNHS